MGQDQKSLLNWYSKNKRDLPWRNTKDPYKIWISEVMLQQTTVKAVIPFYNRFIKRYPTVTVLSQSSLEELYTYWAGLGYYSRANNLHKAAMIIQENGFPKTHQELLSLPGFGPYTSRAVASFAFKNEAGVLDGNVIRFLSRFYGLSIAWWETPHRNHLQTLADEWVKGVDSSIMNQALIEIGATLCTSKSPSCLICPLQKTCVGFRQNLQEMLPLKKKRRELEVWEWRPDIFVKKDKVVLVPNSYTPFLKGKMIFPGRVKRLKNPPKEYNFKHNITHHEIYVKLNIQRKSNCSGDQFQWVSVDQIKRINPTSLIQKALKYL